MSEYKIDKLVVKFSIPKYLTQDKKISYLKYRVIYREKKDFEGYFDCKTIDKTFEHEFEGTELVLR